MSGRLDGQVALVTGGGRGIGRAVGEALGRAGARLALVARRGGELAEAVDAVTAGGGMAMGWRLDVTDPGAVVRMVEESLLGAAGRRWRPQIAEAPPEEYTPARRIGDLLVRIAAGDADPLGGGSCMPRTTWTRCSPTRTGSPPNLLTLGLREWPGVEDDPVPVVGGTR